MNQNKEFSGQEIIDLPSVLERIGGDEAFLQELIKIFLSEFDLKLSQLEKAASEDDFRSIQEIGHNIKGSAANLSLLELQKIAYALETCGRQSDKSGCLENINKLKTARQKLLEQLKYFNWWKEE
jgi:HPt (histidine-containing phosphotransfer) domain-containing protein